MSLPQVMTSQFPEVAECRKPRHLSYFRHLKIKMSKLYLQICSRTYWWYILVVMKFMKFTKTKQMKSVADPETSVRGGGQET